MTNTTKQTMPVGRRAPDVLCIGVLLVIFALSVPVSTASCQAQKLLFFADNDVTLDAQLVSIRDSTLVLYLGGGSLSPDLTDTAHMRVFHANTILAVALVIERSNEGSNFWTGALIGSIVGGTLGFVLSDLATDNEIRDTDALGVVLAKSVASPIVGFLYTALGLISGGLIGGVIAAAMDSSNGHPVVIYTSGQPLQSLRPYAFIQGQEPENIRALR